MKYDSNTTNQKTDKWIYYANAKNMVPKLNHDTVNVIGFMSTWRIFSFKAHSHVSNN
jgi:hypothetical protein